MVHLGRATRGSALVYFLILNQTSEAQRCPTASAKCLRAHGAGGWSQLVPLCPFTPPLLCCTACYAYFKRGFQKQESYFSEDTSRNVISDFFFNVFVLYLGFEGPLPTWDMHRIFQNGLGLKGTNISDQTPQKPPETSSEDI